MNKKNNLKLIFQKNDGFTLMEVLVSVFVILVLTIGVYSLIILSIKLSDDNKKNVEAIEIANEKMEDIRNMPYDDIGVISGDPSGTIPPTEYVLREGSFTIHNYVSFMDDPYDGEAGSSTNPDTIINDYKIVSVRVSWETEMKSKEVTVFSKVIPRTEETAAGYGLLKIYVVDSNGSPIQGASVKIINASSTPPLDETNPTNAAGFFPKPVKQSFQGFQVIVTKAGYSTDQTYAISASNPNPTKPNLSVVEGDKTEDTFTIDLLGGLNIRTVTDTLPTNWQVNQSISSTTSSHPEFGTDSSDNLFFVWQAANSSASSFVYAQKYDATGAKLWPTDHKLAATQFQSNPDIAVGKTGISYVVWQDNSISLKNITLGPKPKADKTRIAHNKNLTFKKQLADSSFFHFWNFSQTSVSSMFSGLGKLFSWGYVKKVTPSENLISLPRAANAAGAISFVAAGAGSATGQVGQITLAKPAGVVSGDFLLAYVFMHDYSSGPIDPPSGWTIYGSGFRPSGSGDDSLGSLFWKIAGASEPASYNFEIHDAYCSPFCVNYEEMAGHIRAYRGVDQASPFYGNLQTQSTNSGDVLRPAPSHAIGKDGSVLITGWGGNTVSLGNGGPTFPAGMGNTRNNFADWVSVESSDLYVNISDSPTPAKNYDANHNVARSTISWSLVLNPEDIPDNITVSATGTQIASIVFPASNQYLGGSFVFTDNTGTHDINSIRITEHGTTNALTDLSQIKLYYDLDTSSPYNCESETFNSGTDPQYGVASSSFSGSDGTADFTQIITISQTQSLCVYAVMDINATAANDDTIEISINNPSIDVKINTGSVLPITPIELSQATNLLKPAETNQAHYRWRNDNGSETSATWNNFEDNQSSIVLGTNIRLRFMISNSGGLSAGGIRHELEYAEKITTCSSAVGWQTAPNDNSRHWRMSDSADLTDAASTTDISNGLSNTAANFVVGEVKDIDSQTNAIALPSDSFTELEFSISPTNNAVDATYCFRLTDAGDSSGFTYSVYPEISLIGDDNVYITALDSNGNELWTAKRLNSSAGIYQGRPQIALTENFGTATTTAVWEDDRDGNMNIYGMSLDANGNKLWADKQITSSTTDEHSPVVAINKDDSIFIAWVNESATGKDIYFAKYDLAGNSLWTAPQTAADSGYDEYDPDITALSDGSIVIAWEENISGIKNISAARFSENGAKIWDIQPNLTNSDSDQMNPSIAADASFIYFSWTDTREGNHDIYVQKYDFSSTAVWSSDLRININTGTSIQQNSKLVINSATEPFATWEDARSGNLEIYSTKFNDPASLSNAPNIPLVITGTKKIGENPIILKYNATSTTDSTGHLNLDLDWDNPGYSIDINSALSGDHIKMIDPTAPFKVLPGETRSITIYID